MIGDSNQLPGQLNIFDFLEDPNPKPPGSAAIREYLRYGPHTKIPQVREAVRRYLEQHGVPDYICWDKESLPCSNCTWYDGSVCRSGGHPCHYEFGCLICDCFRQSIVQRTPRTVGDTFPSHVSKDICKHSGHKCNKFVLWEVADSLDDTQCPHVCCRLCNTRLCGARCNGSEEPHCGTKMESEE